jgi:hypothetical protein
MNIEYSIASAIELLVFPLSWIIDSLGLLAYPRLLDCNNIRFLAVV